MKSSSLVLGVVLLLGVVSCRDTVVRSIREYHSILSLVDNGFVKVRNYQNLIITLKYLPPELQAYTDFNNSEGLSYHESLKAYQKTRTFLLRLKPTDPSSDLLFNSVESYEQYAQLNEELTFNMKENFSLVFKSKELKPIHVSMINNYGLATHRDFLIVFDQKSSSLSSRGDDEISIVFQDIFFNTGISRFRFQESQIDKKYSLSFIK